jgi:hemoglobin
LGDRIGTTVSATPYEQLGGDAGVRALVDRFYDRMDADAALAGIRALHPADLAGSREKLYLFLSGWLGGPALYVARHGHPRLRARHLAFAIGEAERDQWLACMRAALDDCGIGVELAEGLMRAFHDTADFMRNRV